MISRTSLRWATGAAIVVLGGVLAGGALHRLRTRQAAPTATTATDAEPGSISAPPPPAPRPPSEPPLRRDILSLESLEQHGRDIAAQHQVDQRPGDATSLQERVAINEARIQAAAAAFGADVRDGRAITPAAEWLLDNLTIVLDQIREIRVDLPGGYYRELPKLTNDPLAGLPRVYALALDLIAHTDSRIDTVHLIRFILAYQSVSPLSMGELWAVPIMLRVGLVENLGRLAALTLEIRELRREADEWTDRLLAIDNQPSPVVEGDGSVGHVEPPQRPHPLPILAALAARYPDLPVPFAVQMLHRLRGYRVDEDGASAGSWLESYLTDRYVSIESLLHTEHQRQAANQASVGNVVTTMRTLSAIQWADWFEQVSPVEQVLRQDPAGIYARCTFATRDSYRHAVERLARRTQHAEVDVAWQVVAYAGRSAAGQARAAHIGYYLVGAGRPAFEAQLGYRPSPVERLQRAALRTPTPLYLGGIGGLTIGLLGGALAVAGVSPRRRAGLAAAALLLLPATDVAQGLVNWTITRLVKPRVLPRLDLSDGIPGELRTMVVVPMLLLTSASVEGQLDRLEVIYLANSDPHLHFALLSDFADATSPDMPGDAALLQAAMDRVEELNRRHGADRFFLFHRRRVWNSSHDCYMGWERKRGKLEEFNHLLAGATDTTFDVQVGDLSVLPQVRYVITLDADTQLPRDGARALIGTLAHPLNQAVVDPVRRLVVDGYGILQPRIGIDTQSAMRSRFAALFAGNVGIDPYTTAVSDVYMDLFGEGIFAGKGIYDPVALNTVLARRFPDNALLSHDLIEGLFARAALLSDVQLIDNYPTSYVAYAARLHRWIRGDWQISRWLLPTVPRADGGTEANPLSAIDRYKILDNLRRSLMPPATVALLVGGWLGLPRRRGLWTALALGPLALPVVLGLVESLLSLPRAESRSVALRAHLDDVRLRLTRFAVNTAFLADQSLLSLDAIARTLARLLVTQRSLLEWETAAQTEARVRESFSLLLRRLAPALPLAVGMAVVARRRLPRIWPIAAPVVASWVAGPAIATWLDGQRVTPPPALNDDARQTLRHLARKTWDYFATFVTEEGHHLAPDNFQEAPRPVVAYRTSPTNMGLQLLTDMAARDFGYIGLLEMTERTEAVFATLEGLPRYRGHLLNWYDTQTLQPLPPAYVSTVDSGNLAGYLLALRQGYAEIAARPLLAAAACDGLLDTLALLKADLPPAAATTAAEVDALTQQVTACATTAEHVALLNDVAGRAARLPNTGATGRWAGRLQAQVASLLRDMESLLAVATLARLAEANPDGPAARLWHAPPPTLGEASTALGEALADEAADPEAQAELTRARAEIERLLARQGALGDSALDQARQMDFSFLYDDRRDLFSIGYNVVDGRLDNSYYDLLASEARLASFVAIGKGDVPQKHWFHLGRPLTAVDSSAALLSWSGTMFEYLMPLLVMRNYPTTLLDTTYQAVVQRQIEYAHERHVPWGVSESAFNARDLSMNYQYRAFGVPGLGLKRGLGGDLVVAPYATLLSLPVHPAAALDNIQALREAGLEGPYGLYEAVDFTPTRLPPGKTSAIVRSFMAHHQAMSLLALDNLLHADVWQARFHSEPIVQATELLLQERFPHYAPRQEPPHVVEEAQVVEIPAAPASRQFATPHTPVPAAHCLSNGDYSVVITAAGGGFSRYRDRAVTRWREDPTLDDWGAFCYLRDPRSGAVWSTAYQPTRHALDQYRVTCGLDKVEFRQRFAGIDTRLEVTVSPEDAAEVRRITLTNLTTEPREVEVTSYAEIVLAPQAADEAHPAFSNLFIETDYAAEYDALLATRRPRSANETPLWAVHVVAVDGHTLGATQYETDRARFVGRGQSVATPAALGASLSNTTGAVLDPIFSLRRTVRIVPGGRVQVSFTTAIADSRDQALALADKYHDYPGVTRAFEMAWTQSRVELHHLNLTPDTAQHYQWLASTLVYNDARLRARSTILAHNQQGQPRLWAYGVSGDFPIVVVRITGSGELSLVRELLQAHEYWRLKGVAADLVILNEHASGYLQGIQDQILALCHATNAGAWLNRRGGIFVLRADTMPTEDHILFQTVARAVFNGQNGDLAAQLAVKEGQRVERHGPTGAASTTPIGTPTRPTPGEAGLASGAFTPDGSEYVIELQPGQATPAPWINVVTNENFGFIVSERGAGYTWSENSRENRLTPWSNDPISDPSGEAIYLRDEEDGALWSPTPQPLDDGAHRVRHGFGYTVFEHERDGIASELSLFVPRADSVKVYRLRLRNTSDRPRRLSATFYAEWTLGVFRHHMAPFIITDHDPATGALFAHNPYNNEFSARVAFAATDSSDSAWTCDRRDFLGRNGDRRAPAGLRRRSAWHGRRGAGLDPCAALMRTLELPPGAEREIVFLLGEGADRRDAQRLVAQYRDLATVAAAETDVKAWWRDLLGSVRVETPQPEMDVLLNGWLLYQTLACRVWARSAFYQSGGAYGFRDQLQDVMALTLAAPDITRAHILRAAGRQFVEGDVQHWWHPPTGRGIRTRFSDDYLWLPFVLSHYLAATGEVAILDETIPFLEGRPLAEDEAEYYDTPTVSATTGSLYEHGVRALEHGLRFGAHGLPLMGTGDWNDGMNRVGEGGRGESVWVGFFLYLNLMQWADLAAQRGDDERATRYRAEAERLRGALETQAWDGAWYLRAYYDDGVPLGSAHSDECQIDSLTQSWSVISGVAPAERARQALAAVDERLVDRENRLIKLFTPPFDNSDHNPGYIKGYVPGVRENGGQYTHAALWVVWAYALLGEGATATELFALLNPLTHAAHDAERYKVEPYVVVGDIYTAAGHVGRGGWTWYTGSAGWMYRLGIEMLLGFRKEGTRVTLAPSIPASWPGYRITYRYGQTTYEIIVTAAASGVAPQVLIDGNASGDSRVTLVDDGAAHKVEIQLAEAA